MCYLHIKIEKILQGCNYSNKQKKNITKWMLHVYHGCVAISSPNGITNNEKATILACLKLHQNAATKRIALDIFTTKKDGQICFCLLLVCIKQMPSHMHAAFLTLFTSVSFKYFVDCLYFFSLIALDASFVFCVIIHVFVYFSVAFLCHAIVS